MVCGASRFLWFDHVRIVPGRRDSDVAVRGGGMGRYPDDADCVFRVQGSESAQLCGGTCDRDLVFDRRDVGSKGRRRMERGYEYRTQRADDDQRGGGEYRRFICRRRGGAVRYHPLC